MEARPGERLHQRMDTLPAGELKAAERYLEYLREYGAPFVQALMNAPEMSEPLGDEGREALDEVPGIQVHACLHCVANKAPNPGRHRMLFETSKGRRRLFRPGDPSHPRRSSGKDLPRDDETPPAYRGLIEWYRNEYAGGGCREADPILSLRGLGKALRADEDADACVERLREGWG